MVAKELISRMANIQTMEKLTVISLLVACLVLFGARQAQSLDWRKLVSPCLGPCPKLELDVVFGSINSFLKQHVISDDVYININHAKGWIDGTVGNKPTNKQTIESIKQFAYLSECDGLRVCNQRCSDTLTKIKRGVRAARESNQPHDRIDTIFEHYSSRHVSQCLQVYKTQFAEALKSIPVQVLTSGDVFVEQVFFMRALSWRTYQRYKRLTDIDKPLDKLPLESLLLWVETPDDLSYLDDSYLPYKYLLEAHRNDPEIPYITDIGVPLERQELGLREMFERHWVKPCEIFVQSVKEIFEPAKYIITHVYRPNWPVDNEDHVKFYKSWAKYNICDWLTGPKKQKIYNKIQYVVFHSQWPKFSYF